MPESPTFICEFQGGQITAMTVNTPTAQLDLVRGVRLAQYAFQSRTKREPPAIAKARFEIDRLVINGRNVHAPGKIVPGTVIAEYDALPPAAELDDAEHGS